ncbi:MAG: PAS domain S-box protein [Deltaproteobacteria bacterium]|nr:PAS domain S-box protein [Deltaproteobacteria bacterium]
MVLMKRLQRFRETHWRDDNIRLKTILPLGVALTFVMLFTAVMVFWMEWVEIEEELEKINQQVESSVLRMGDQDKALMSALLDSLAMNDNLLNAMETQNAHRVSGEVQPLFEKFKASGRVSHLRVFSAQGKLLARLHPGAKDSPQLPESLTQGGRWDISFALTQDAAGTIVYQGLRPVVKKGRVIGYVSLGLNPQQLLQDLRKQGVNLILLTDKRHTQQDIWQSRIAVEGHQGNWDFSASHALAGGASAIPPQVAEELAGKTLSPGHVGHTLWMFLHSAIHARLVELHDTEGNSLGLMLEVVDLSQHHYFIFHSLLFFILGLLAIMLVLGVGFYVYLGRVETSLFSTRTHLAATQRARDMAEAQVKAIFDNIRDGFFLLANDWSIRFVNHQASELLGSEQRDVFNKELWDVFPELASHFFKPLQTAMRENTPVTDEGYYPPQNRWLDLRAFPTPNGLAVYLLDITARKQAEAILTENQAALEKTVHQRTQELHKSEERTRVILQSAADGIITISQQGIIQSFNQTAERIFGWTAQEVIGKNVDMLMPEPYHSEHQGYLERYAATGVPRIIGKAQREVAGLRKDGSTFPLDLSVSKAVFDEGPIFVGMVRDITTRKEAEEEMRQARRQAEAANVAKSHFLSSMSHELRTPLNSIMGFAQLMQAENAGKENLEQKEYLEYIMKGGQHLLALIDEVLDLAKIESGNVRFSIEPIQVAHVVEECLSINRPVAFKRNVTLVNGLNPETPAWIKADASRLRQILLNFLSNAIKYNKEGGQATVTVCPGETGRIRLCVTDTGKGIPAAKQAQVFLPFNRLGMEMSSVEGTGIGLAISKKITELMQGSIGMESREGEGSSFWVEFPQAEPMEITPEASSREEHQGGNTGPHGIASGASKLVLYVEDNPDNLRLMTKILAQRPDIRLLTAPSAEIGLDLAVAHRPKLILMDLNLPGMDGFEALEKLKTLPETADIPVVAVSANAMPKQIERGKNAGFVEYLTKPIQLGPFYQVLNQILSQNQDTP